MRSDFVVDWATHEATAYACKNWHYSRTVPRGKLVKVGAWEHGRFIGVVLFGRGACQHMLGKYQLKQTQGCELVRVALRGHTVPVSQIVARAISMLKRSQNLELVVSYADPEQGHLGIIYQAGNWVYVGRSAESVLVYYKGEWRHSRSVYGAGMPKKKTPGKFTYLMPLTKRMRRQIMLLSKSYPKRVQSIDSDVLDVQSRKGGANPTCTLQPSDQADG